MRLLLIGFGATLSFAAEPVRVKDYNALCDWNQFAIQNSQNVNEVEVEGYLLPGYECPPCPREALCGPCAPDFVILSDEATPCTKRPCSREIALPISASVKQKDLRPGDRATVLLRMSRTAKVLNFETAVEREHRAKQTKANQDESKRLTEQLGKNPNLVPAKRPAWLDGIPGKSFELKN